MDKLRTCCLNRVNTDRENREKSVICYEQGKSRILCKVQLHDIIFYFKIINKDEKNPKITDLLGKFYSLVYQAVQIHMKDFQDGNYIIAILWESD